ncbi:MAG: nucleoside deaminase [Thermoanaerobacteraceae bacterium]|nr:nucleoside deaminase [Thermoanaerobacteraceae bacterium]
MGEALAEARKAFEKGEVPIGAVVVHRGDIVARAHNLRETAKDPTAHAEILALQEASRVLGGWRILDSVLYVTLEPCPMCAGALVMARIDCLVYGAKDPKAGAVESLMNLVQFPKLNHQVEVIGGVRETECSNILKQFFRKLRDKK